MTFTDQQFEALAPFEQTFETVTRSNYASYVGFRRAKLIHQIMQEAGIENSRVNYACGACVIRMLKRVAPLWLADKAARLAAAQEAEAAQKTAEEAPKPAPKKKTTKPKAEKK